MYCGSCGKELTDEAAYCSACGTPVCRENARVERELTHTDAIDSSTSKQIQPNHKHCKVGMLSRRSIVIKICITLICMVLLLVIVWSVKYRSNTWRSVSSSGDVLVYNRYRLVVSRDTDGSSGKFILYQGADKVASDNGCDFIIGLPDGMLKGKHSMGDDVNKNGIGDLILTCDHGGAHGAYTTYIYELGNTFRVLGKLEYNAGSISVLQGGNGNTLAFKVNDVSFNYWHAPYAESPKPELIISWDGNEYTVDIMATKQLDRGLGNLDYIANDISLSQESSRSLDSRMWAEMLDLLYSGRKDDAWAFLNKCWPVDVGGMPVNLTATSSDGVTKTAMSIDQFRTEFIKQLNTSEYWKQMEPSSKRSNSFHVSWTRSLRGLKVRSIAVGDVMGDGRNRLIVLDDSEIMDDNNNSQGTIRMLSWNSIEYLVERNVATVKLFFQCEAGVETLPTKDGRIAIIFSSAINDSNVKCPFELHAWQYRTSSGGNDISFLHASTTGKYRVTAATSSDQTTLVSGLSRTGVSTAHPFVLDLPIDINNLNRWFDSGVIQAKIIRHDSNDGCAVADFDGDDELEYVCSDWWQDLPTNLCIYENSGKNQIIDKGYFKVPTTWICRGKAYIVVASSPADGSVLDESLVIYAWNGKRYVSKWKSKPLGVIYDIVGGDPDNYGKNGLIVVSAVDNRESLITRIDFE